MKLSTLRPIILTIADNILVTEIPLLEEAKYHSYIENEGDQLVFTFGDVTLWVPDNTDVFFIIKAIRVYVKAVSDEKYKISGLMVNTRGVKTYNQKTKRLNTLEPNESQSEDLKQLVLQKLKERELTANRPNRGNVYDIITNELEKEDVKAMFNQPADIIQQADDIDPFSWAKPKVNAPSVPTTSSEPIPDPEEQDLTLPGEDTTDEFNQPEIDDANDYYNVPGNDYYDQPDALPSDPQDQSDIKQDLEQPVAEPDKPAIDDGGFFDDYGAQDIPQSEIADVIQDQPAAELDMPSLSDTDVVDDVRPQLSDRIDNAINTIEPSQEPEKTTSISSPDIDQQDVQSAPASEPEPVAEPSQEYQPTVPGEVQSSSLGDKIDAALNDKELDGAPLTAPIEPSAPFAPSVTQPEVKPGTTEVTRSNVSSEPERVPREKRKPNISSTFSWENLDMSRGVAKTSKNQLNALIGRALETNPLDDAPKAALGLLSNNVSPTKQEKVFEYKGNMSIYKNAKMKRNIESINEWAKSALGISGNFVTIETDRIRIKLP